MADLKLNGLEGFHEYPGSLVVIVMDGVGLGPSDESNGVYMAYTPVLDQLLHERLFMQLKAHGRAVGLASDSDMGNSEVGHNALGAGRIYAQGARLVNEAIKSGAIFNSKAWHGVRSSAEQGCTVHLIGLVSDGNVHSHLDHLYAILDHAAAEGIKKVRVHGLLDGRDVGERSALSYFEPLEQKLRELSTENRDYQIASGGGRMTVTMDRYNADWSVVERGWKAHVLGEGRYFSSACEAISTYYQEDSELTDQYMDSFVIARDGEPVGTIEDGDAVICFNFRGDRAIEISRAFEEDDFNEFDRRRVPDVFYAGMLEYDGDAHIPSNYLVEPPTIRSTLGEYLCGSGVSSFAISETQKFGHVTYFWNGNKSGYINESLEKYVEIKSDKVPFDQRPWMKSAEISDAVIDAVNSGEYDFIRLNLPNGDMVGHTGIEASVRIAMESVDLSLKRILNAVRKARGVALITADHGNSDCMWTEKNGRRSPMVAHTTNPVPMIIKDYSGENRFTLNRIENPGLTNVAATICNLLGFAAPESYDPSLIVLEKQ